MAQLFSRNVIAAGVACVGLGLALHAGEARALVVEVGGVSYDVTTLTGSYNANSATLQAQVWFGNASLANEFASKVLGSLGTFNGFFGPIFAYGTFSDPGPSQDNVEGKAYDSDSETVKTFLAYSSVSHTYAVAQQASNPVPAPLPFFGAMAGFGVSRRLRARIQAASSRRVVL